jgi:uncharacterized protein DUF2066
MTLSLLPAGAGCRGGWRLAGSALLVVLALGVMGAPSRAQDTDPFSATVAVDATANSAAQAREAARTDGQRRALAAVAERLSGGSTGAKLPKLDDKAITDLVASFEVANERMSAVRYAGDYTFHFRPEEIRRVLGNPGLGNPASSNPAPANPAPANPGPAASEESAKPMVLIPVYQSVGPARLWEDPNPWRQAWEQQPAGTGAARLLVPLGDAGDIAALDADKARAGDGGALAAIARRNGGDEALVALAVLRGPPDRPDGLDVTVKRYRADRLVDSHMEPLTANPGEREGELLRRGAAAIVSDIGSGWKNEAAAHNDPEGSLTAILPITDLDDWVQARERLAKVPMIRKVALMALSRQEATIEIGYGGSIDQLKAGLAEISLDLVRGDPLWRIARSGSARRP